MKSNQEILNEFGEIITNNCYDPSYIDLYALRKHENPPLIVKKYSDFLKKINHEDFQILIEYTKEKTGSLMFNFLRIFEEHHEFKLIYEENGQQIDLTKISESLMAEPIIENGWIQRFSQEINNKK
jgi:hypothetical protein